MVELTLTTDVLVELLRKLGHDLRSPLGSVISTGDMLEHGVYEALMPRQMKAVARIQRSSSRALAILDDFMTYIKAEAGQINVMAASFEPRAMLTTWYELVRPTAEQKGLELTLTVLDDVPAAMTGDTALMSRIVLPVLWNAITFTTTGAVHLQADWRNNCLMIHVCDSGTGIAHQDIPRIFEPFWQGSERPPTTTAGVGMGLAVARAVAKVTGGSVTLEATGHAGSTFCCELR